MSDQFGPDPTILEGLITMKMPYGKYKGYVLRNIPEYYLVWMHQQGFPKGKLGAMLETLYEIKLNGLEYLLDGLSARRR
jgi:uncharacterized protein (DUF3820 family)